MAILKATTMAKALAAAIIPRGGYQSAQPARPPWMAPALPGHYDLEALADDYVDLDNRACIEVFGRLR